MPSVCPHTNTGRVATHLHWKATAAGMGKDKTHADLMDVCGDLTGMGGDIKTQVVAHCTAIFFHCAIVFLAKYKYGCGKALVQCFPPQKKSWASTCGHLPSSGRGDRRREGCDAQGARNAMRGAHGGAHLWENFIRRRLTRAIAPCHGICGGQYAQSVPCNNAKFQWHPEAWRK